MDSLYDIKDYQDYAKPSDSMGENNYTQDVFIQTRPDIFDNGDNPYYQFYNEQNDVTDKEFSDFNRTYDPRQYDNQDSTLVNPYKKIKDLRFMPNKASAIIASSRLEESPIVLAYNELVDSRGYNLYELLRDTSNFSKNHSPKCLVSKLREDTKNRTWSFHVKGMKKDSDPKGHVVFVRLENDPKEKNLMKTRVHVSCSCPFWKYWGPDYNAKNLEYLEGKPKSNGGAPNDRDPGRQNKICKHVYAIGQVFSRISIVKEVDVTKEVGDILKKTDKDFNPAEVEDISYLKDSLQLDRSEIKEIDPIINKYNKEKDPKKREKIKDEAMKKVEDILSNKPKNVLQKIQTGLKSLYQKVKNKLFKKSSVNSVLEMYVNDIGDSDANV